MAKVKTKDQPVFEVQVNLLYRLHAKDKMSALGTVLQRIELMTPPGGVSREVKWNGVKEMDQ
jgi:hypothetical protein